MPFQTATPAAIDQVLALPGTGLVIQQQNISRRVTPEQYRKVLEAACAGTIADVQPAEPGARGQKGVSGLSQDVAPSLLWGLDHVPLLETRLSELRKNQSIGAAIPLARKYFPDIPGDPVPLKPSLYVVMGGRAGAAAIDEHLYFDLLISEWRISRGAAPPMTPANVVEFFAHETHHLGYGEILDRKRATLKLTPGEDQAWRVLTSTLMEGSATLLINGHEKLSDLEQQSDVKTYLTRVPELLPAMQGLLRRVLNEHVSEETYAEASTPFFDMGYHASGAVLLAAIEKKRGLAGVLSVMEDPRRLLSAYNDCAGESSVGFQFDTALAERIAHLGEGRQLR